MVLEPEEARQAVLEAAEALARAPYHALDGASAEPGHRLSPCG